MLIAMVAEPHWHNCPPLVMLFVKSSHGLCAVSVYLNGSVVDFRHRLQLDIVSPNTVHSFARHILLEVFVASNNKLHKECLLALDVVHACLSNKHVVILTPIVNLIGNSSEQAVAISLHLRNLESLECKHPSEIVLFFFDNDEFFLDLLPLFHTHTCKQFLLSLREPCWVVFGVHLRIQNELLFLFIENSLVLREVEFGLAIG